MKKGEPRFPLVHPLRYVLWQESRKDRVYTDIKIANNNKINHIMVSFTGSPQKLKLEIFHGVLIILFYVIPSSPQLQRLFFFYYKNKKATTLQQVTGGNTSNFVLKRILRYFLKIPPLKKIQNLLFY